MGQKQSTGGLWFCAGGVPTGVSVDYLSHQREQALGQDLCINVRTFFPQFIKENLRSALCNAWSISVIHVLSFTLCLSELEGPMSHPGSLSAFKCLFHNTMQETRSNSLSKEPLDLSPL